MFGQCAPEIPATLSAGDTWAWTMSLAMAVDASSSLVYSFRAVGQTPITATGVLSSDRLSFAVTVPASVTAPLARGKYAFVARLTVGNVAQTIRMGVLNVLPNFADPKAEIRSPLQIRYDAIQQTLAGLERRQNGTWSGGDGVSYTSTDVEKMQRQADRLKQQLDIEQGRGGATTIRTAFGRPCALYGSDWRG